jgi:hypothetical protein
MNCPRCNGLAVRDDSIALQTGMSSDFHSWRCVNCGMVVDDVITWNRHLSPQRRISRGVAAHRRYSREAA